jgi:phospholipid/cholesterol/gamma-HCH transport system substrate-binding protein
MELDFNRREKIVGVFILCIAILLLTTVVVIGRGKDWFKKYITYYTIFDQSYNLKIDTPVKLYNADIGKIKHIDLVGNKVKITLLISDEFRSRIRTSARATVQSPTFIGSEHIAIIPGADDAPLILEEGIIPSKKKKSFTEILEEFQVEKTAKMIVEAAQNISAMVNILGDPQGPFFTALENLNKTMTNVEKITHGIQSGQGTLGELIQSRALLDQFHTNLDEVGNIINNISEASAKTPTTIEQVQVNLATLQEIEKGLLESLPNIQSIVKDVDEATDTLNIILKNIEKGSHDIPDVIRSTNKAVEELRDAVNNIDHTVQSLQQSVFLRPHLPSKPQGKNVDAGFRQ